jgi:hypothetical protein
MDNPPYLAKTQVVRVEVIKLSLRAYIATGSSRDLPCVEITAP